MNRSLSQAQAPTTDPKIFNEAVFRRIRHSDSWSPRSWIPRSNRGVAALSALAMAAIAIGAVTWVFWEQVAASHRSPSSAVVQAIPAPPVFSDDELHLSVQGTTSRRYEGESKESSSISPPVGSISLESSVPDDVGETSLDSPVETAPLNHISIQ